MEQPNKQTNLNQQTQRPRRQRKYKYASSVGMLFIIFAVIGIITVVWGSIRLTGEVMDNSREKEMFAKKIQPVAMFNPVPFESPTDLDNESLLFYCMWTTLSNEDAKKLATSENRDIMVTASALDVAAGSLFGDVVTLNHASFGDDFNRYNYNEEDMTYYIPPAGELYVYTARVEEVRKNSKNFYSLVVGYLPPPNAWTTIYAGGLGDTVDKTMIYVMERVGDDWHLVMIVDDPNSSTLEGLESRPETTNPTLGLSEGITSSSAQDQQGDDDTPDGSPAILTSSASEAAE